MTSNEDIKRQIALLSGAIQIHKEQLSLHSKPSHQHQKPFQKRNTTWVRDKKASCLPASSNQQQSYSFVKTTPYAMSATSKPTGFVQSQHQKLVNLRVIPDQSIAQTSSNITLQSGQFSQDNTNTDVGLDQPSTTCYTRHNNSLIRLDHAQSFKNNSVNYSKRKLADTSFNPRKAPSMSKNKKLLVRDGMLYRSNSRTLISAALLTSDSKSDGSIHSDWKRNTTNMSYSNPVGNAYENNRHSYIKPNGFGLHKSKTLRRVNINGTEFMTDLSGRKLIRTTDANQGSIKSTPRNVLVNGVQFVRSKRGNLILAKTIQKTRQASGALSLQNRVSRSSKFKWEKTRWNSAKKKGYCQFYRYGRCDKGDACRFIHDRRRIALCFSFLKTKTCNDMPDCKLSHEPTDATTPFCVHFERGRCSNEDCHYLHVKLSPGAHVCADFAKQGYCEKGSMCLQRHIFLCPDYEKNGECPLGEKCRLPHRSKTKPTRPVSYNDASRNGSSALLTEEDTDEELQLPPRPDFRQLQLDIQDVSFNSRNHDEKESMDDEVMKDDDFDSDVDDDSGESDTFESISNRQDIYTVDILSDEDSSRYSIDHDDVDD
ncbi:hypothetical protein BDV3_000130 [Batrachochytrium dendrobatidis]